MAWHSMANAPKDRKVDLWAKTWDAEHDRFEFRRFTDCRWWERDSMGSWKEHWHDLPKGWLATHWMDTPAGPDDAPEIDISKGIFVSKEAIFP